MIEVLVALGVMFSALTVLAYTMLSGLTAVGFSRQRTEATALGNQALEQIRALPANQLYMSTSDVAGDIQLVSCGSNTCFNGRTVPVANFGSSPATTPFTPSHVTNTTGAPGNTPYTVKSYLTLDPTDPSGHTLVATVQVSWTASQKGGVASHVQVETKIYNNQFNEAPPTVHTFDVKAQTVPGTISVTGTVLGASLLNVTFNLPSTQAGMNGTTIPGTTNVGAAGSPVSSSIAQSGITAAGQTLLNTPATSVSAQSLAGTATDGPHTGTATPTLGNNLSSQLSLLDAGAVSGTVAVGSVENTSAVAGSTYAANSSLGYGQGTASQTGALSANVGVNALTNLLNIGVVSLVPTGSAAPDQSTVNESGTSTPLQTYNGSATQSFTTIDIGNLSLLGLPLTNLVSLTGFKKSVAVCAGPATATCNPAPAINTGSISILGQTPIPIANLLSGLVPVSTLNGLLLNPVSLPPLTTLGVSGTGISLGSTPSVSTGSASIGSPLSIDLHLTATVLGINLLNVTIDVNLGSVSATASYS
jgi:hypothetical protein